MRRVIPSTAVFLATQTDAEALSPITNLSDLVPSKANVEPTALKMAGTPPGDLTVSKVILRSVKRAAEVAHVLFDGLGSSVPIADVMDAFTRVSMQGEGLTDLVLDPDHGVELVFTYSNGATQFSPVILWDVQNQTKKRPEPDKSIEHKIDASNKDPQNFRKRLGGGGDPGDL